MGKHIAAIYDYHDADGNLVSQAVRHEPKGFSQRRPDGNGGWMWNLEGVTPVLYHLPEVLEQIKRGGAVYLVEGEKDVHTLEVLGLVATCNPMGAGKWKPHYSEALQGADLVILPDNDDPGHDHAEMVAQSLHGKANSVKVVKLPGLEPYGDVSDWLTAGHSADELSELVADAPLYEPPEGESEASWGELQELPPESPDPPDMPDELLPAPLRPWILDAAERACVHVAFIAVVALSALGAVLGRTLGIHPKRRDDWLEVANLWAAIVAPPSSLKTLAIREGTSHVRRLAADAIKEYEEQKATTAAHLEVLKLELDTLKRAARKKDANPADFQADIQAKLAEIQSLEEVTAKRYLVNDVTMEKAGELLMQNPRGLLYLRDELIGLLKACDKPGHENDRPFLLEACNGQGSYTFDRIGRGTLHVPALTLSLCGGIQPGRFNSYIADALAEGDGADGLLQRFQLITWFDRLRTWKRVDRYPDKEARDAAFKIFEFFDRKVGTLPGSENDALDPDRIPALRFDAEAQGLFNAWYDDLMVRLRSGEYDHTPAFHAHLAKYPSLMPSLALLFHLMDLAASKEEATQLTSVSFDAAALAIAWCEYLELHARKVYARELDAAAMSARALAERIERGEVRDGQKVSTIYSHKWPGLITAGEVEAALEVLEGLNQVRVEMVANEGARDSQVLRIHPDLRGGA